MSLMTLDHSMNIGDNDRGLAIGAIQGESAELQANTIAFAGSSLATGRLVRFVNSASGGRRRQKKDTRSKHRSCQEHLPGTVGHMDKSAEFDSSFERKQPFPPLLDGLASPDEVQESYAEDESVTSPGYDEVEVEDDADFQSHYSLDPQSLSGSETDDSSDDIGRRHPFHQSSSSLHSANAFAPPFYNRPPTPLPPSPSLTSLLRPPFSTTTSRPTTPDSSDVETPNDTEAAVAKSARRATTVPRASPKVPTYEYYGFVLYLASSLAFCQYSQAPQTARAAFSVCILTRDMGN